MKVSKVFEHFSRTLLIKLPKIDRCYYKWQVNAQFEQRLLFLTKLFVCENALLGTLTILAF